MRVKACPTNPRKVLRCSDGSPRAVACAPSGCCLAVEPLILNHPEWPIIFPPPESFWRQAGYLCPAQPIATEFLIAFHYSPPGDPLPCPPDGSAPEYQVAVRIRNTCANPVTWEVVTSQLRDCLNEGGGCCQAPIWTAEPPGGTLPPFGTVDVLATSHACSAGCCTCRCDDADCLLIRQLDPPDLGYPQKPSVSACGFGLCRDEGYTAEPNSCDDCEPKTIAVQLQVTPSTISQPLIHPCLNAPQSGGPPCTRCYENVGWHKAYYTPRLSINWSFNFHFNPNGLCDVRIGPPGQPGHYLDFRNWSNPGCTGAETPSFQQLYTAWPRLRLEAVDTSGIRVLFSGGIEAPFDIGWWCDQFIACGARAINCPLPQPPGNDLYGWHRLNIIGPPDDQYYCYPWNYHIVRVRFIVQ